MEESQNSAYSNIYLLHLIVCDISSTPSLKTMKGNANVNHMP